MDKVIKTKTLVQSNLSISWLTEGFIDVDLPIVKRLSKDHKVNWIITHHTKGVAFDTNELKKIASDPELDIKLHLTDKRNLSFRNVKFYFNRIKELKKHNPDVIYLDITGFPYFYFLVVLFLPLSKVVYAAHDVENHLNIKFRWYYQFYNKFKFTFLQNFHFFSSSQEVIFKRVYEKKKHAWFVAGLYLKDYGKKLNLLANEPKINFLFFGTIRENKGLSVLINAVNRLTAQERAKINIIVAGKCDNWEKYSNQIEDQSVYETHIKSIPNEDIPVFFSRAHYCILPYLDVTQSGVLMVALHYSVPSIASDFQEFRNYISDGETGYLFDIKDPMALTSKLRLVLQSHETLFDRIKKNVESFVQENISIDTIAKQYETFFSSIGNHKKKNNI